MAKSLLLVRSLAVLMIDYILTSKSGPFLSFVLMCLSHMTSCI